MEEIFVKKEKMLEPEYVKILKDNVKLRFDTTIMEMAADGKL